MVILMANKKSFYDITDVVPELIEQWGEGTEEEAIQALMRDSGCTFYVRGKTPVEAMKNLIKIKEGLK